MCIYVGAYYRPEIMSYMKCVIQGYSRAANLTVCARIVSGISRLLCMMT